MTDAKDFNDELMELKQTFSARDRRMGDVRLARTPGGLQQVFPDMFPSEGPYKQSMVANMVDVAAKDTAEVLSPLPTLSCTPPNGATDRAKKYADKKTKIAYGYTDASALGVNILGFCDRYATYSWGVGVVKIDFDRKLPIIQFLDPIGCYPVLNQWGKTRRLYQTLSITERQARYQFPDLAKRMDRDFRSTKNGRIEIVRIFDEGADAIITPMYPDMVLFAADNPIGSCMAHTFIRPGLLDEPVGAYDDVLAVQVAKARFALLTLEAATKAVEAPMALPTDVQEINLGPDATLRSSTPEKIRRVPLDVPQAAFLQQRDLDDELRQGARYPQTRTGNTDASVVTGRGVQALGAGFDSQIKAAQLVIAHGLEVLIGKCFEVDEKIWPKVEKSISGNLNGTPYELRYTPGKDIDGDYKINVQYGLMAGLQANQALVFGLQARGDKLISRSFLRTQLPIALDPAEEESKVDVEDLRDGLKEAFAQMAAAIPQAAAAGQPPTQILSQMAAVITARQKGVPIEEAIADAFTPEPETAPETTAEGGMEEPGQMLPPGGDAMGGPQAGVLPQQPSNGMRPDMMQMIAGLTGGGRPSLGASVVRRSPV